MTGSVTNCCTQKTAIKSAHALADISRRMVEDTKHGKIVPRLISERSYNLSSMMKDAFVELIRATGVMVLRDDHWLCAANFMQVK